MKKRPASTGQACVSVRLGLNYILPTPFQKGDYVMVKRLADWFEKMSVAALAIGLFQVKFLAALCGVIFFVASMVLTHRMKKEEQ
jgi:hypothetical protein